MLSNFDAIFEAADFPQVTVQHSLRSELNDKSGE